MDPDIQRKFPAAIDPRRRDRFNLFIFRLLHPFGVHLVARRYRLGDNDVLYDMGSSCMFCKT